MSKFSFWKFLRRARSLSPRPVTKTETTDEEEPKVDENILISIPVRRCHSLDQYGQSSLPTPRVLGPSHYCKKCGHSFCCCKDQPCIIVEKNYWNPNVHLRINDFKKPYRSLVRTKKKLFLFFAIIMHTHDLFFLLS